MKFLASALTVALVAAAAEGGARAAITPPNLAGRPWIELAGGGSKARDQRILTWDRVPLRAERAWGELVRKAPGWRAGWDDVTGVPVRMFGPGIPAPGSVSSAAAAEAAARAFLAEHIALFAPGGDVNDFTVVANDLSPTPGGPMRTVGFAQRHEGLTVLYGRVNFRFKNDRLFMAGSEAWPDVTVEDVKPSVTLEQAKDAARAWIAKEADSTSPIDASGPFILPIVRERGGLSYRLVFSVTVATEAPIGKWTVYVDARTGAAIERRQALMFVTGTIQYNASERWPGGPRDDYPAARADEIVNSAPQTTDANGTVTWPDGAPAQVTTAVSGPLVHVIAAQGAQATIDFALNPGESHAYNDANTELIDSQLSTFIHVQEVNRYCKGIAPSMAWLDVGNNATVNVHDVCNAYSDGTDLNLFASGAGCENTGRLSDVVYHEFGHSFHNHAIIPGVGFFEPSLSEGQSDYLSSTIHDDPKMGIGFFFTPEPLRDIDPPDREYVWPDDIDPDPHATGQIISGALWDLRKLLVAKLGTTLGVTLTDQLYYGGIQRATDIPTMYPEVLAADDDDGDITNGTPNVCEINQAFGLHGLRTISSKLTPLGAEPPKQDGYKVSIQLTGLYPQCPDDIATAGTLTWKLREDVGLPKTIAMTPIANGYEATIPAQEPDEVVNFAVDVGFQGSTPLHYPDNVADPMYEFYVGEVVKLYCTDFEKDPNLEGWTHGVTKGKKTNDDWQWGTPAGAPGSGDPKAAFSGMNVFGNDLGHGNYNGSYTPSTTSFAKTPAIDTTGYPTVRVQYRRWLNVEDANFDTATIYANGEVRWQNYDSMMGDNSHTQHQDKEWRFHDVDVSPEAQSGSVTIQYELASDEGLEFGGWTLDDFCVVGVKAPVCGNGVQEKGEQCDDGAANSDTAANACRTSCKKPRCGDGVVDNGEACDDGNADETDRCRKDCTVNPNGTDKAAITAGGCGCRTDRGETPSWFLVAIGTFACTRLLRRRRRHVV